MKRSTTATLLLMGLAPLLLTACDDPDMGAPAAASQQQSFTSVDQCVAAGVPKDTCQRAYDNKPQFASQDQCVARYGAGQCQQSVSGDHSVWMPMLTGFMIGRMLDNTGHYNYISSGPVYRSTGGGVYGGSYSRGSSGWSTASTPSYGSGAGSHAITASRGGFGSSSAMSGGWGG